MMRNSLCKYGVEKYDVVGQNTLAKHLTIYNRANLFTAKSVEATRLRMSCVV
jgi:hypothetical protein